MTAYSAFVSILASQNFSANLADFHQNHSTQRISDQVDRQGLRIATLEHRVAVVIPEMLTKEKFFQPPQPRQINWFSFALGARVNPSKDFTSPPGRGVPPHYVLMAPGEPGTPIYCGPRGRVELQVAISTPRVITPAILTIEHFKKGEVLTIGNAPKIVELWIALEDENIHEAVREEIIRYYPGIFTRPSFQDTVILNQKPLNESIWVPIGQWTYDIWAAEQVQDFQPPIDLNLLNVASDQFVVRVKSNWGNKEETCLARVRLQGTAREREDFLEQPEKLTEEEAKLVEYV